MTDRYDHCEECLAYYLKGTKHVCPPWLKALVGFKKDITKGLPDKSKEAL